MAERVMHGGDIYRNRVQYDFSINVNPLGMPEGVREAMREAADLCGQYPDLHAEALRRAIGGFYGVPMEQILCGSGSSELLMAVAHALRPEKTVIPVPSFSEYERAALAADSTVTYFFPGRSGEWEHAVPEQQDFSLSGEGTPRQLKEILTRDVSLLFLANPNNPTGTCIRQAVLENLLDHCRETGIVVVLDECFLDFVENGDARSCLFEMTRWPNLIVLRTFTKIFAVPGVRLGWMACADTEMRERIERHLPEWNVSVPAQQAGMAAVKILRETSYPEETRRLVKEGREHLTRGLRRLGARVYPSEADFLLFFSEVPLYEPLLSRGFLIRDCADFRGLGEGYYRIAVRTGEENRLLLAVMEEILCKEE